MFYQKILINGKYTSPRFHTTKYKNLLNPNRLLLNIAFIVFLLFYLIYSSIPSKSFPISITILNIKMLIFFGSFKISSDSLKYLLGLPIYWIFGYGFAIYLLVVSYSNYYSFVIFFRHFNVVVGQTPVCVYQQLILQVTKNMESVTT